MKAVTHLEKVIAGEVSAVTHLEKVIAEETSAVTYTEKVIAGVAPPITHLEKVIAGIADPITHLEYVWAGRTPEPTEHEYTGAVPVTFTADGTPLLDFLLSGNMEQTGTPTPQTPIQPQECGEMTGNLFDISRFSYIGEGAYSIDDTAVTMVGNSQANTYYLTWQENPAGTYRLSFESDTASNCYYVIASDYDLSNVRLEGNALTMSAPIAPKLQKSYAGFKNSSQKSFTIVSDVPFILAIAPTQTSYTISNIMLNTGSTALPYEPYGVKIPISSANTKTPVYLGEVQTTRKIGKLVIDGTELWQFSSSDSNRTVCYINQSMSNVVGYCSHILWKSSYESSDYNRIVYLSSQGGLLYISLDNALLAGQTLQDFKTYLQQQYAAGTPVTVWYVLAESTTGVVNEPIRKIGNYIDTLSMEQAGVSIPTLNGQTVVDVDTTLKPSEVYIKYQG